MGVIRALHILEQSWVLHGLSHVAHLPHSCGLFLGAESPRLFILTYKKYFVSLLPRVLLRFLLLKHFLVLPPKTLAVLLLLSRHFGSFKAVDCEGYDDHEEDAREESE